MPPKERQKSLEAWVSKIAMEHSPFIDSLPMNISIKNDLHRISNLKPIKSHVYHMFPIISLFLYMFYYFLSQTMQIPGGTWGCSTSRPSQASDSVSRPWVVPPNPWESTNELLQFDMMGVDHSWPFNELGFWIWLAMIGWFFLCFFLFGHVYLPTFWFTSKGGAKLDWSVTKSCCWSSCRFSLSYLHHRSQVSWSFLWVIKWLPGKVRM